jgi:hypothetical protein
MTRRTMIYTYTPEAFWLLGETQPDGCVLWLGKLNEQGYGRMGPTLTGTTYAHRTAWILTHERAVPAGMTVNHTCHSDSSCKAGRHCPHRRCINPEHLELIPLAENSKLGRGHYRMPELCPKGHQKKTGSTGRRYCPVCLKAAEEAWLAKDGNRERQNEMRRERHKRNS